jgi:hypothetical protein
MYGGSFDLHCPNDLATANFLSIIWFRQVGCQVDELALGSKLLN